jgi:KaiC/GvpD/RAD55 family RecA-like ATPase
MQEFDSKKMPTGISSLDPILDGGVPPGSVILFLGDLGAGSNEFVYSSMINLLDAQKKGDLKDKTAPKELRYITFTRLKDDVRKEIVNSLHVDNVSQLVDSIQFDDLSELYFDSSVVPDEWYSHSDLLTRMQKRSGHENVLVQLSNVINTTQSNTPNSWSNLTGFLRGLQRVSKQRDLSCYLLLTQGILSSAQEKELSDIADAVILFKWEESTGSRRQRVMYFEKFRGVMPHLEERDLVKFAVRISTTSGFEVSNIRVVI